MKIALAVLYSLFASSIVNAAEIQVLCSNGLKAVMEDLAPQFEKATGHKVVVKFGLAAGFKQQIESGAPFDLTVLTPPMIDDLIKQGRLHPATLWGGGLMLLSQPGRLWLSQTDAWNALAARLIGYILNPSPLSHYRRAEPMERSAA